MKLENNYAVEEVFTYTTFSARIFRNETCVDQMDILAINN